jgi:anti-anti-sigma regulatory factor
LTKLTREVTARTLVLDLTGAGPIDSAATDCLRRLAARQRQRGGELCLIGVDQQLLASISKDCLLEEVGTVIRRDDEANNSSNSSRHLPLRQENFCAAEPQAALHLKQISPSGGQ